MKTKTLIGSKISVFKACKKAVGQLGWEIDELKETLGIIKCSTGSSLLAWGSEIDIKIKVTIDKKIKVTVASISKAQLISWGANEENEKKFIDELSSIRL